MASSSNQPLRLSKGSNSRAPTSSFGFRFHQEGRPNVYFRTEPDLTSDPNQVWVPLDTSEIRFQNYTPQNMSGAFDSAAPREESRDEAGPRSRKRPKIDSAIQAKPGKTSSTPVFRVNNPVKVEIPDDIWRLILKQSHPTVLLILRHMNQVLYRLLQEQSIWKASRDKLHGNDMPGPPGDMTEQRYAQLLYGQGCDFQRFKCGSSMTKKVYWPFLLRMCDACFRRKTEKDKAVRMLTYQQVGVDICELIPAGMTSSGKYTRTRRLHGANWEVLTSAVYLRTDFESTLAEYQHLVHASASADEIDVWKAGKLAKAQALMAECEKIEDFQKDLTLTQPRHRDARAQFFAAQAAKLTPPLGKDVMERMMAFKMSLDSNHEPTLRSWADLKRKLLPHREAAEKLLDLVKQNEPYHPTYQMSTAIQDFRGLHNLRVRETSSKPLLPEQAFVINLCQQRLRRCQERRVADADLVLLVLKDFYDTYQSLPIQGRPRGTNIDMLQGVYRLTLDDARMIVKNVIEPEVRGWPDNHRVREALEKFKCVGCVRKDCTTRYTFDRLFQHVHDKHAIYVADGEDFHKLYRPLDHSIFGIDFPWYTVEWPKNLPVAASHHLVSREKKWLADADLPYIPAPPFETVPAFSGRRPFDNPDIRADDFEGNLIYAAFKLRSTRLGVLCQMRAVLQYALGRFAISHGAATPSLADFIACQVKLQEVNEDFTLTFACGVCKQDPDIPQSAMHTRAESLTKLREHFDKIHSTHDWTVSLIDLPSDIQLAQTLIDVDEELRKEKHDTKEREASLAKNPRKKADPNARIILLKPEAVAIFDELFPKIGHLR